MVDRISTLMETHQAARLVLAGAERSYRAVHDLLNDAMNKVSDQTVLRTFATASAIMLVAMLAALFAARIMKGHSAVTTA